MELRTEPMENSFVVELKELAEYEERVLIELGFIQMPLYWRLNDHPHTVGNLILLRRIEFQCVPVHTGRQGLVVVQKKMQMLADIVRKHSLGGSPSRFDPRKDSLPSLEIGGTLATMGDAPSRLTKRG